MTADPDPKKLGPKLKAASGKVRDELMEIDPKELAKIAKETGVDVEVEGQSYHLEEDDFRFHEVLSDRWAIGGEGGEVEVLLDLHLTDGIAREVVRRIQTMRKDMDLQYDARITLRISGTQNIISGVKKFNDYIMHETLADVLEIVDSAQGVEWDLEQGKMNINITL